MGCWWWIGTERNGLTLSQVKRAGGELCPVDILLNVPDLQAHRTVAAHYANGFDDLIEFFRSLATGWRGWSGERTYQSLEGDPRLAAVHDCHIQLTVRLRQSTEPNGWDVKASIRLDPDEEMSVVDEMETLLEQGVYPPDHRLVGPTFDDDGAKGLDETQSSACT